MGSAINAFDDCVPTVDRLRLDPVTTPVVPHDDAAYRNNPDQRRLAGPGAQLHVATLGCAMITTSAEQSPDSRRQVRRVDVERVAGDGPFDRLDLLLHQPHLHVVEIAYQR